VNPRSNVEAEVHHVSPPDLAGDVIGETGDFGADARLIQLELREEILAIRQIRY
jgi:hypothetical protein